MSSKIKTITLSHGWPDPRLDGNHIWSVEKITDSITYNPGQMLEIDDVDYLCNSKDWKVTIVPRRRYP